MAMMKVFDTLKRVRRRPAPSSQGDGAAHADDLAASEMAFLDHLEELRWSLLKGLGGMLVTVIVCSFFAPWIVDTVLLGPKNPDFVTYRLLGIEAQDFVLQNRTISGQFFAYMGTVLFAGMVLGSPFLVYQLWRFIEPGLYPSERQGLRFAAVGATFFFMVGLAFGYFFITPLSLQFFASFTLSPEISNEFDITKYFSMVTFWSLGIGLLFELPVVIYFLSKIGILTPALLRTSRKYAFVIVLIVAAFITPPDPFSQILVTIPLMGLYELSILVSARVEKQRQKELADEGLGAT